MGSLLLVLVNFSFLAAQQSDVPFNFQTITAETSKGVIIWKIELANDNKSRMVGLMNRPSMPENTGMLFDFGRSQGVAMWMKNTFIPLDMVFIRRDGTISSVARNTVPQSLEVISSREPIRYVLEINAGEAENFGLKAGVQMRHPWFVLQ